VARDVRPWVPGDGYLYDLEVQLVDPAGALVDSYHQSVGVRTVEVRDTEFLINGEPFRFTGFGMHEDHPTLGKGHNPAFLVQDFALLEWIGANSFRTSHYPYSEDVLDLADSRGIVVIDETAQAVHAQAIHELVARDKNHPCVVLWSIANEPESETAEAEDYFRPLFDVARAADPTRPVGFVNVMLAPHEYGADTLPGLHGVAPQPWTEEYQVEYLAMNHRVFDRLDAVVGEHVWNFADFATTPGIMRVGGNKKGVFTRDRSPKAAAFALRRRWRECGAGVRVLTER